jgi:uncharacterized cupredoxin-like copper-binding protein
VTQHQPARPRRTLLRTHRRSRVAVEPGSTGETVRTFSAGDEVLIGCHQPGHYDDAGMRLMVAVADV